jgi:hypothetical protein
MNALSQEARALIDSVARHDEPSDSDKARLRARLAAELGAAAFAALAVTSASGTTLAITGATPSAGAASAAAKSSAASLFGKLALTSAVLLAIASGLWLGAGKSGSVREQPRAAAVQRENVAPATTAPPAAQDITEPSATGAPHDERATSTATGARPLQQRQSVLARAERTRQDELTTSNTPPKVAPAAGTLGRELKLLGAAQAALRAGSPERALVLTAQHRASFPEGVMKEERLGIEALAGCALGRDYRAQAEAFLKAAQSSPLRTRVQKACGIEP